MSRKKQIKSAASDLFPKILSANVYSSEKKFIKPPAVIELSGDRSLLQQNSPVSSKS